LYSGRYDVALTLAAALWRRKSPVVRSCSL
jgi:hypothetical protein